MYATTVAATSNAAGDERPERPPPRAGERVARGRELTRSFRRHHRREVVGPVDRARFRSSLDRSERCGKTTTVRLLSGVCSVRVRVRHCCVWALPPTHLSAASRRELGYLPQIPRCSPTCRYGRTALSRLDVRAPAAASSFAVAMLEWVELDEHRHKKVAEASGGMQRRLRWPRRSCMTRRSCSSTSRLRASTRSCARSSGTLPRLAASGRRCS